VALDLLLAREPWLNDAQPMWEARDAGHLFAYLPASVLTDIFYICRKHVGLDRAKHAVEGCLQGFTIIAVDRPLIAAALAQPGNDFEDNVQIASAQLAELDFIVTRNIADFAHSPVSAIEPSAIVSHLDRSTNQNTD
jgi:predicted nucleic acid-binding protein